MFGEGQGVVKSTSQPNSLSIRSYYSQLTMSIFSPLLIRNWGVGGKKKKRKKRGKEKEKKKPLERFLNLMKQLFIQMYSHQPLTEHLAQE